MNLDETNVQRFARSTEAEKVQAGQLSERGCYGHLTEHAAAAAHSRETQELPFNVRRLCHIGRQPDGENGEPDAGKSMSLLGIHC